ncbi:hypothetical protein [Nocardia huaxiensis]|uniref:Uncharacterized protein n=1 Tax=Nocardia huaxiensis TaxID=2755382 RepID=A0A7D7A1I7_9NOCA|nr:hypothetical protein [Nocardia huaxiensis]QLY33669.1 hypothetical protein H0264_16810 [Nocardia huaxiensis]UFS99415.1 hypothetical protein LPY97_16715 [Nocardia huaxiensis]
MMFRKPLAITLLTAALATGAGAAAATASAAPLNLEPVATDPNAQNHDPLANGAAAGAGIGAAAGAGVGALMTSPLLIIPGIGSAAVGSAALSGAINWGIIGTVVGLATGAIAPDAVPQVLP